MARLREMKALDILNPADSAVIDASFQSKVPAFVPADSSASIRQKTFDNDADYI